EYTLPSGVIAKEVLRRAHTVAHSDPKGPVYLMLPRETIAAAVDEAQVRSFPGERYGAVPAGAADPQAVTQLAERLVAAQRPVLITSYAGRNPAVPALIDELARFAGIRVIEASPMNLNLSRASPCHGGFAAGTHVSEADVGLMVDVDVPWIPKDTAENPRSFWAQIDIDAVKKDMPLWGFPSDLRLQGDSRLILGQLLGTLRERATPRFREAAAARVAALAREREQRHAQAAQAAAAPGGAGAINAHHLCAAVGAAIGEDAVVVNESVQSSPIALAQIPRTQPGTYFRVAGGGLGCSGGVALGAKLARPEALVVQIIGDGGFYFNNPAALYAVSRQYRLPILTVVIDNGGWSAVKQATLQVYPEGEARARGSYQAALAPEVDFVQVARGAGACGETVTDPAEVPAAVRRCIAEVRAGRSAVLHAHVAAL
ncbi:MAG TPA: thiamine pyrophosphate-dependent enzyme, partial [Burkholderiales bacterium]|nr:thiamine pyrophosphate-dependent enzyme [Burkholderiales bacterium]